MRFLTQKTILDKNSLATDAVFTYLLEIYIPNTPTIKVTLNSEDIHWRNDIYKAVVFQLDRISDTSTGEVPQVRLKVSNISGAFDDYIAQYDALLKQNGVFGNEIKCILYFINTNDLNNDTPMGDNYYTLISPSVNSQWATFTLGADSPLGNRCPKRRIFKNHCDFILGDNNCKYAGDATECGKTLAHCLALGNTLNYGGFPGIGGTGVSF